MTHASSSSCDTCILLLIIDRYAKQLDSKIADMSNIGNGPYGGAITAALYLQKFITEGK